MTEAPTKVVTGQASSNIAVIKYWGKRDEKLILPLNGSISFTLDPRDLGTLTTVAVSAEFKEDRIWLNGVEQDIENARIQNVLRRLRGLDVDGRRVRIASTNNFPTAAGLASSASGYACLVFTLAQAFGFQESFPGELSTIARMGSGSACRSMFGGVVQWDVGERPDGIDSTAVQLFNAEHWPDLEVLIAVVSDAEKRTSSTTGMQTSVETSPLLAHRAQNIVPKRLLEMKEAIARHDFPAFARLTMQDSNQFHATCLDTYPPICYLTDTSRALIDFVHAFNRAVGEDVVDPPPPLPSSLPSQACYTFDAGPNAVLFTTTPQLPRLLAGLKAAFPASPDTEFIRGSTLHERLGGVPLEAIVPEEIPSVEPLTPGTLKHILHTTVGRDPVVVSHAVDDSLLDGTTWTPRR